VPAEANNNANENDSCYDSGTGEGWTVYCYLGTGEGWTDCCARVLLLRHNKELN